MNICSSRPFAAISVATTALCVAGCLGSSPGEAGRLGFSYDTDDGFADFDVPVAVGAEIDLRAQDPSSGSPLTVGAATSDSPSVVEVVGIELGAVTLRAVGEGRARIYLTASLRGESVTDSIVVTAAPAGRVELAHACPGTADGVYLASSRVVVGFELLGADGSARTGRGLLPVELAPSSTLALDDEQRSMRYLALRSGPDASRATIASTIDDARLVLDVVPEGAIDDAELRFGESGGNVAVGATGFVAVQPSTAGRGVCQGAPAIEAIEMSPQVCSVIVVREPRSDDVLGRTAGWLQIHGRSPGTCSFAVRYPNARDGAGLDVPFSLPVR